MRHFSNSHTQSCSAPQRWVEDGRVEIYVGPEPSDFGLTLGAPCEIQSLSFQLPLQLLRSSVSARHRPLISRRGPTARRRRRRWLPLPITGAASTLADRSAAPGATSATFIPTPGVSST